MTLDIYISTTSRVVQSGRAMAPHSDAATQAGRTGVRRSDIGATPPVHQGIHRNHPEK